MGPAMTPGLAHCKCLKNPASGNRHLFVDVEIVEYNLSQFKLKFNNFITDKVHSSPNDSK